MQIYIYIFVFVCVFLIIHFDNRYYIYVLCYNPNNLIQKFITCSYETVSTFLSKILDSAFLMQKSPRVIGEKLDSTSIVVVLGSKRVKCTLMPVYKVIVNDQTKSRSKKIKWFRKVV